MELISGKELQNGKYRIIDVLGQGGFGITYLAQQVSLGRKVAIKEFFMKEHCNRDETSSFVSVPSTGSRDLVEHFKQKFLKEARTIASFTSSSIVNVFDVFEENGTAYYVMEYLEGDSLKAIVDREGAIPEETAVKYIRQIGSALSEIHSKKLVHLDIKPANIMLNFKGEAVLIDFGISKHYDETGSQTSSGLVGLSEGYAPMEQYKKGGLTSFSPATDIYSLGATLFKLLTGQTPPHASDVNDDGLPPMPETLSATVRKAVESAMQPRRKDRPQSVEEFLRLVESGEMRYESGEMKDATSIFGNASSDGSSAASQNVMPLGSQKASVAKDERAKSKDETSLSMGTGQNAANGNAAVEENEIEVEVVEVPSAAQKPASEPKQPKEKKSSKGLWIVILLLLVIGGAAVGFMLLGSGGDVKKDSAKDTAQQIAQKADTRTIQIEKKDTITPQNQIVPAEPETEQTAQLKINGAPDGANVYVDGKYFDKTPFKGATISIGEHAIKVVKEGYETYEKTHTFNSQSAAIDVNIKKSTALLYLSTNPSGASVYVDGSYIGTSYISGYKVEQGSHKIKITKQGYKDIVETHNFSSGSKNLSFNLSEKDITPSEANAKADAAYNKKDYSEAVKWYRKAAEQGNAWAEFRLGWCYQKGYGVSQSWSETVKWYRKAAEQGNAQAQYNLGNRYKKGEGVTQSYSEAVKWYRKAAEQGHADAQCSLGLRYEKGEGVTQSYSEAVKWYRKAAEQGEMYAQCNLGWCYYNGKGVSKSYYEAVKWYRKAAEQGHARAQFNLGLCYENGEGVTQSYLEAVKWYRKAAEQGHADAQCSLGLRYEKGEGVTQSYSEAVKWYRKAAEQGDEYAQCNLGWCYYYGKGVSQSYYEAVKWYRKAAEQGLARAQCNLGFCYKKGYGVSKSWSEAVKWYRKAAEQGNAQAQHNLGVCYENGEGVSKSISDAVKWYRKAAEQGHQSAKDALKRLGY